MTEDLKKEIIDLLDNVTYWDTCPEDYKTRIDEIKEQLTIPVVVSTLTCQHPYNKVEQNDKGQIVCKVCNKKLAS